MFLNSISYDLEGNFQLSNYFKISSNLSASIKAVVIKIIRKKSFVVYMGALVKKNLTN
jgi:hypothetical protein